MTFAVTGLGTAVITSFLCITFIFASLLRLPMKSILAVTVLSCARNSSIAIVVIENLPHNVGDKDLMFFPIVFVYLAMVVIINSFGYFMIIKDEENVNQQSTEECEEKPLTKTQVSEISKENCDVMLLVKSFETKEKVVKAVNPFDQKTFHDMPSVDMHRTALTTLPTIELITAV